MRWIGRIAALAALVLLGACASQPRMDTMPPDFAQRGIASWYGPGFVGRHTADGERFDPNALTAAHRFLPFGSVVRVSNLANGRSVRVRINDRGPFVRGRIIDLSWAAARSIGMIAAGTAPVLVQAWPSDDTIATN